MTAITSSRVVPAQIEDAVAVFLDWSQDPRWRDQVRRITLDPPGPASCDQRIVEELRFMGLTFVTPTRIEQSGPTDAHYCGGTGIVAVSGSRHVSLVSPGHVELVATLDVTLRGLLRPLTDLLAPSYRRQQERDLDRLVVLLTS